MKPKTTTDIDKREDIYNAIDALEKEAYQISEKVLEEILPEAFAVVKETARRFKENSNITVTATPKDRELSATKSYITLDGENAVWANTWNAAGKEITWDMIHYDVQLIGGIVLHQGKIAEMQTGEGKTLDSNFAFILKRLNRKRCTLGNRKRLFGETWQYLESTIVRVPRIDGRLYRQPLA